MERIEYKHRTLLIFFLDKIRKELAKLTYAQGKSHRVTSSRFMSDGGDSKMEQFKKICSEDNIERVNHTMKLAFGDAETFIAKWARGVKKCKLSFDNTPDNQQQYMIEIMSDYALEENLSKQLERLIEEYVTVYILEDWASITYPEGQKQWTDKKETLEYKIREMFTLTDEDFCVRIQPTWM